MKENSSEKIELRKKLFIEKATIKHNKYDYSKVVYSNNKTKVEIICPIHGSFWQRPDMHSNVGNGCIECELDKKRIKQRIPFNIFLEKAKKIHGDKYDYSVSTDYRGMTEKVTIKCKQCEYIFKQDAYAHCGVGHNCPQCMNSLPFTTTDFIKKASKIHSDKYDYSKTIYIKNDKKLEITCKRCNQSFFQIANDHLTGHGCRKCNAYESCSIRLNKEIFIDRSKKIHGDKYDYSSVVYVGCQKKVIIHCKKCNLNFNQQPLQHLQGSGCPTCAKLNFQSKMEENFLNSINIPNRQIFIENCAVDGYDDGIIYEFLGDYWHGNPRRYEPTKINVCNKKTFKQLYQETIDRFNYLKDKGYIIKFIWETDWLNYIKKKTATLNIQTFSGEKI